MTVFGKNTIIDFNMLKNNKITNLYGVNDAGKTSVIECITLALTGKSTKKGITNEFIHNGEKEGKLYLELIVNDDEYKIIRTYKKIEEPKHTIVTLEIVKNNEEIIFDKDKKKSGEKYIETNICTLDELLTTSIIEQERNNSILLSNNKLATILKYINMDVFNEIIELCTSDNKSKMNIIKDTSKKIIENTTMITIDEKKIDTELIISTYEKSTEEVKNEINQKTNIINTVSKKIYDYEKEIIELKTKADLNDETYDEKLVEEKSKEYNEKKNKLKEKENQLKELRKEIKKNKITADIKTIRNNLELCQKNILDDGGLITNKEECNKLLNIKNGKLEKLKKNKMYNSVEISNIMSNYIYFNNNKLLDEIKKIAKKKELDKYYKEAGENPEEQYKELLEYFDMDPIKIQKNIFELEKEISNLNNRIMNIDNNNKIKEYTEVLVKQENYLESKKNMEIVKLEITNLKLEVDNIYKLVLAENEKEDKIKINVKYLERINILEKEKKSDTLKLEIYNIELKRLKDKLNKITEEETKLKIYCGDYNNLQQLIKDNEIILAIMNKVFIKDMLHNQVIHIMEDSANAILKYIGIDEIKIDMKLNTQNLDANIVRKMDKTNILRSGKFYYNCYDLILRLVLNRLNPLIKQDYLIIDEIMDGVSDKNKDKMFRMFDYFKDYYGWTLIITHDESIRQYIEHSLTISKENGYSVIA